MLNSGMYKGITARTGLKPEKSRYTVRLLFTKIGVNKQKYMFTHELRASDTSPEEKWVFTGISDIVQCGFEIYPPGF